ncbi:DUF2339 domain-containing protein [Ideonella sp. DXS29W]|uniref:DUF2339 domain-containing protein n=1 Tax=Ideonella lacteola TaxID=2984193 RepID=A0ABU9BJT0_9BURK
MKWFFGLLGAVVGGLLGDFAGVLVGLMLGVGGAALIQSSARRDKEDEPDEASSDKARPSGPRPVRLTLDQRLAALEQQVRQLQSEVARLRASAAESAAALAAARVAPGAARSPGADAPVPSAALTRREEAPDVASVPLRVPPAPMVPAIPEAVTAAPIAAELRPADALLDEALARVTAEATPAAAAIPNDTATPMRAVPDEAETPSPSMAAPAEVDIAIDVLAASAAEPAVAAKAPATPPAPPPPPAVPLRDRLPPVVRDWIFGGNTIVKVGVLVLFLGLAFLLRYAAERITVPPELRYAGVALLGVGLLGLGWRLRDRRDAAGGTGYGLILQGAGIGVLYLTTLASLKLNGLIPPEAAFVFLFAVTVLSAVLAVVQNAPWLAYVAVAEGFAAPVLVSSGGGHHHVLFSYMLVLDIGVFLVAWFKAWRPLNLVAFVGTFTLASGWAQGRYEPTLYTGVQVYLILFFLLFTGIGLLFARRALAASDLPDGADPLARRAMQALAQVGRVDSALVFGVPLVAFGLQYLLVQDWAYGPAWAALGFSMFYLLLGGLTMKRGGPRYALLGEAYVIVSVIFGTLAIPLALEGVWTGATWAIEAAGMYWLGVRQHRPYARAFALLVLFGAAVRTFSSLGVDESPGTPWLTGSVLGMALLATGALAMHAVSLRRRAAEPSVAEAGQPAAAMAAWETLGEAVQWAIGVAALTTIAWMLLVPTWASVVTSGLALGLALWPERWRSAAQPWSVVCLQAVALCGFLATLQVLHGQAMLGNGGSGLVAAVLIAASLMACAWLALPASLRARWRELQDDTAASAEVARWPLGVTIGWLVGVAALGGSLLFVMPADQAARVWPAVGLACLWLGLRLRHDPLVITGWGWQVVSGVCALVYGEPLWSSTVAGMTLWTPWLLTLAGLIAGDMLRREAGRQFTRNWLKSPVAQWGLVVWVLWWWSQVLPPEVWRGLSQRGGDAIDWWMPLLLAWVTLSSALLTALARWRQWQVVGQSTCITVPGWILLAWTSLAVSGDAPHAHAGWLIWPMSLVWHLVLLRQQARWVPERLQSPLHVLGFWLFAIVAAREGQWALAQVGAPESAWPALGWVAMPAAVLALLTRPALLRRWPLSAFRDAYLLAGAAPVAAYLLLWVWFSNLLSGEAAPLPYIPLLNPLELGHGLVLLSLLLWFRALPDSAQRWLPRDLRVLALGATAFVLYTGLLLRTCHHWAAVPWDGGSLFASTLTQATLSVAWALLGVALMVLGHKRVRRAVWVAGAALLAVVVLKLFFIELADHGGLYRIVSFIVVGLLLLVVGYFAPVPPRREEAAEAAAATNEAAA